MAKKPKVQILVTHLDAGVTDEVYSVGKNINLDENFSKNIDALFQDHQNFYGKEASGLEIRESDTNIDSNWAPFAEQILEQIKKRPQLVRVSAPRNLFNHHQGMDIYTLCTQHRQYNKSAHETDRKILWASWGMYAIGMLSGISAFFSLGLILVSNALSPKGVIGTLLRQRSLLEKLTSMGAKPEIEQGKWGNRFYWGLAALGGLAMVSAFFLEGTLGLALIAGTSIGLSVLGWFAADWRNKYLNESVKFYTTKQQVKEVTDEGEKAALAHGLAASHWLGYLMSYGHYCTYRHPRAFAAGLALAEMEETHTIKAIRKINKPAV